MAFDFGTVVEQLGQYGFFTYVLPFVLIFVIAYGLLVRTKVLPSAMLNLALAFVISLFSTLFLASIPGIDSFFASVFGRLGIILVLLLIGMLIYGFVSGSSSK